MPSKADRYRLHSVDNALRILEAFSEEPEMHPSEVSSKLGLTKSCVFRLMKTLEGRGFLSKNAVTGRYRLGYKAIYLGTPLSAKSEFVRTAHPFLERLAEETGETAQFAVFDNGEAIFIDKVESKRLFATASRIGSRMPAYSTATGKILLSCLPEKDFEQYLRRTRLRRLTPNTITDAHALRMEIDRVKRLGYSVDDQESEEGLMCLAVPLADHNGHPVAMSVSGPASRLQNRRDEYLAVLRKYAAEIAESFIQRG